MSAYIIGGSLLGYALAPMVVLPLIQAYGLSSLVYLILPGILVSILLWRSGADTLKVEDNNKKTEVRLPGADSIKWLIILNVIVACRYWAIAVVIGFMPLLFITMGYTYTSAGLLLTVLLAMGALGIFAGGYLCDLLPRKRY